MKKENVRSLFLDGTRQVEQFDFTNPYIDVRRLIESNATMGFSARNIGLACQIFSRMINDESTTILFAVAGSTSGAGCAKIYRDLMQYNMLDMFISNGATPIDMHLGIEELKTGSGHFRLPSNVQFDDRVLFEAEIDRLFTAVSDNESLIMCDDLFTKIAQRINGGHFSSMEYLHLVGKYLSEQTALLKTSSLLQVAYEQSVPVLLPAFADCSAGIGTMLYNDTLPKRDPRRVTIDTMTDLEDSAEMLLNVAQRGGATGVVIVGGGVPKNWAQDLIIAAQRLADAREIDIEIPMHKYAVQVSLALEQDGGCSGSTLSEAMSWGKVNVTDEENTVMVFAEATGVLPLMTNYAFRSMTKKRDAQRLMDA